MGFLRTFFELNHEIIYFAYGLMFFVVGLSIALQSRNSSRLDLARSLKWLAAFGFTHGFNEWGDLFIPIQSAYLAPRTVVLLHDFHLLILALSFAFLFQFGVALLRPLGRARWLHGASSALLASWFFLVFFPLQQLITDFQLWHATANALARYFIGFPAGLLAAYGLRQHAMQRIVPLQVPHIVKMLKFAGVMFLLYAFFSGLVPPPVTFFPGSVINSQTFEQAFGVPAPVFRSLIGLGLAVAIIRALEVFNVETERMIENMEQQQVLAAERARIARDLHDGVIQKVYTAGLLVESAHKYAGSDPLGSRLEKAEFVLNDAISDLRRNLVELHAAPANVPLSEALSSLTQDSRFSSMVNIVLEADLPAVDPLTSVQANHILAIVNEALSNAVRHARASRVNIRACLEDSQLRLDIRDNGLGLPSELKAGFGLRNMRDRARLLGGKLDIHSDTGKGTLVKLVVPWKDER